jgi:hypothetical protein
MGDYSLWASFGQAQTSWAGGPTKELGSQAPLSGVVAPAKSRPPVVTRWVGQRLEEALRVGDQFEVHRGGGAHQSG